MVQGYSSSSYQVIFQVLGYWGYGFSPQNFFNFRPEFNMDRIRLKANGNFFVLSPNEQRYHQRIFLCKSFGGSCTFVC